ncbi:MAG: hypothetical protein ABW061_04740, partial [Polyangiaceae bacterium]
ILWLLSGCSAPAPREIARPLLVHTLASCPLPTPAQLDLKALGDFPATPNTSETLSFSAENVRLGLPLDTLALEASALPDFSDETFIGFGARASEQLELVLWPRGRACDLFDGGSYPDQLGGQALGYGSSSGLLMVAGSNQSDSPSVVGALTFDTRSGESQVVDPRVRSVLSVARAFATISDFGPKLLVAGGENSLFESAPLNDSAEVYDPSSQSFESELLKLAVPRAHHAALSLLSGEVALLGGLGPDTAASSYVEVVTPSTHGSKLVDNLWLARNAPTALRLSDGRVFVGGGTDRSGHPVAGLEWRDPDATLRLLAPFDGSIELSPRFDRAFAALPGGAVLAVGGCEDREPSAGEDCSSWCAHGCPPEPDARTGQRFDAYWISPEGSVSALDFPLGAAQPVLLPGSDGRPWLVASDSDAQGQPAASRRRLYRFDPWQQAFERAPVDLALDEAQSVPQFVAIGSDAFAWLDQRAANPVLHGVRLGTRSAFSNDTNLIEERDAEDVTRPAHLAPDHPPGDWLSYDSVNASLSFATRDASAGSACVWLTDAEFADFSAEIVVTSSTAPSLRLGALWLSDPASPNRDDVCALPALGDEQSGTLSVTRRGSRLTVNLGGALSECTVSEERMALGVCASDRGPARITRLRVTRAD